MKLTAKYILGIFTLLVLPLVFNSCTDDNLDINKGGGIIEEDGKTYLSFALNLQSLSKASDVTLGSNKEVDEEYEDYIDQSNLRLLFYYADEYLDDDKTVKNPKYNTLFYEVKPTELSLIPIEESNSGKTNLWYVRVPINDYNSTFAEALRNNNFKIAVLANWEDPINNKNLPKLTIGSHISTLHHLEKNNIYSKNENKKKPILAYQFLLDSDNNLGFNKDWVQNGEDGTSEDVAETFIRTQYGPQNDPARSKYGDLWLYWNFQNAKTFNPKEEKEPDTDVNFVYAWKKKNNDDLGEWLNDLGTDNVLKDFVPQNSATGKFEFLGPNAYYDTEKGGIVLPKADNESDYNNQDVIKFMVPASGTLYVKWGSSDGRNAKIYIDRRNHKGDNSPKDRKDPTQSKEIAEYDFSLTDGEEYISIFSHEGSPIIYEIEYICASYLYSIDRKGKNPRYQSIPMYGVQVFDKIPEEYWEKGTSFDLSNFNQTGPTPYPNPENEEITVTPYKFKSVYLLRSVAKVELKIPIKENPHHVFLRSMNRKGFCEPMDVSTPTHLLWEDNGAFNKHNQYCEWFYLIGQQPFYNPGTNDSSEDQLKNYKEHLAWYYGSWSSGNTDGSRTLGGVPVPDSNTYNNYSSNESPNEFLHHKVNAEYEEQGMPSDFIEGYPHILNPMIDRSDFCEFLYAGQSEGKYERYVLYVPEKFVDDPNDVVVYDNDGNLVGMEVSDPKVCHIEFRTNQYPFNNLDDNNCYRIYFTTNGFNSAYTGSGTSNPPNFEKDEQSGTYNTWENLYEKNPDNLKVHWPIMRNHVYSFTVLDTNSAILVVQLDVLPWNEISDNDNTYEW